MGWLIKQYGDIIVVYVEGALDAVTVPSAEVFLNKQLQEGHYKIVLNFQNATYMSSAGIRLLFSLSKMLQSHKGLLCICHLPTVIAEVIQMAGVDQIIPTCQSEQECFSKF